MPWLIVFYAMGEHFYPSRIDFEFSEAHGPDNLGIGGRNRLGFASIRVPATIPNEERIRYLVNLVSPLMPDILKAGADDCRLDIGRFYTSQCNEELSSEELSLIASLHCSLTYSAYQVSVEEETELKAELEDY